MTSHPLIYTVRRLWLPAVLGAVAVGLVAVVIAAGGPVSLGTGLTDARAQEDPTDEPTPAETATELPISARLSTYEVFLARDPFEPVIPELQGTDDGGGGADGAASAPTTSPTTAPPGGGDGGDSDGGNGDDDDPGDDGSSDGDGNGRPSDGCRSDGTVTCDGEVVSLVDVFREDGGDVAAVRVDETVHEVRTGQDFASNYRVLAIEAPCVTLQFGDDRFTLCEGEAVLK